MLLFGEVGCCFCTWVCPVVSPCPLKTSGLDFPCAGKHGSECLDGSFSLRARAFSGRSVCCGEFCAPSLMALISSSLWNAHCWDVCCLSWSFCFFPKLLQLLVSIFSFLGSLLTFFSNLLKRFQSAFCFFCELIFVFILFHKCK